MKTELNKELSTELNKESEFKGCRVNGFVMLFVNLVMLLGVAFLIYKSATTTGLVSTIYGISAGLLAVLSIIWLGGYVMLEPNECTVMVFFGKYRGTFYKTGLSWVHPFLTAKIVSLRQKNLNVDPIKVNDKNGNPILIGLVLVWKVENVYKAMFEIDTDTSSDMTASKKRMRQFESFVRVQSDAALRQVAGEYAYDNLGSANHELTLRSGGDEINSQLIKKLNERLEMSGLEVLEARINYLAYAPEIAAVMLRRQQAEAIISAREKIVEGAVTMVKMAIDKLSDDEVVDLDNDKKAAMVSNLLVVLCADESAQPVVNTGTLNQ